MKNNDVELIHRILNGDDTAFSQLVQRYQKQVHALAWRKIGDFHIAEEITQDTFLKAYQKLATLRKPTHFAGWIYVIATRCCHAWLRKKQIQTESLDEIDNEELEPEAYSRYVAEEGAKITVDAQRQVVKKLLATLPESERTVITLHYFGEMTCEKISEFLGVSANTIKSRLRRARNRLKQEEPMIREAITNFKISPNLTNNIMQEITKLKPTVPSINKPFIPWIIGASSAFSIMLMLGIGSQYIGHFQLPYSLDAQSETTVELVDVQIVQNLEVEPIVQNHSGEHSETGGSDNRNGNETNQVLSDDGDYTRWNLPEGAKRRLGKGVLTDMKVSPSGTHLAIASSIGIWLYDVSAKPETRSAEFALLTEHKGKVGQLTFSPDGKMFASIGIDKTIQLWETGTGKHLFTMTTPKPTGEFRSLKFLDDGKTLAGQCWDDYKVYLWGITSGKYIKSYRPKLPKIRFGQLSDWQFATDTFFDQIGNITFAIGNKDGTISIQEGRTGMEKIRLIGQTDETQYFTVDREHDFLNPRKPTVRRVLVRPDDNPIIPKQRKVDGTPYPIQYLLSTPNYSSSTYEKQPTKWIHTLEFSPDGKTLVSTSQYRIADADGRGYSGTGGPIEIWDVETGEQLASLALHISDVIFSGDGKTLAITGSGGVSVWDIAIRQEIGVFNDAKKVVFSGDGKTLCIIENNRYTVWDITTRSDIATLNPHRENTIYLPERCMLSQNGDLLATVDVEGVINVWETTTSTQIRTLTRDYEKTFTSLVFGKDGNTLVSGDAVGYLQFWDTKTGNKRVVSKAGKRNIDGLIFTENDTILTAVSEEDLTFRYSSTGEIVSYKLPNALGWSGNTSMGDGTSMRVSTFTFSSNGKRLATKNSENKMVNIWDITEGKNPIHLTEIEHQWGPISFSPDGSTLASASLSDNGIDLWNANTGELLTKLEIPKKVFVKYNNITALAFSHHGNILAGGTNKNEIHLWDFASYTHINILKTHKHPVCALLFSPDNTVLASGDTGGGICLWEFPNRTLLATYKSSAGGYISELAFSPDGKTLASTSGSSNSPKTPGGAIFLWDVPSK